jgi:hypothetical protein
MPHAPAPGHERLSLPSLAVACCAAYCKQEGIDVVVDDFGPASQFPALLSSHQHHCFDGQSFVAEIPDLTLVLGLVENFRLGRPLLAEFDELLLRYVQYASLNFFALKDGLAQALEIIDRRIDAIATCETVGFTTTMANTLFSVMCTLRLRQKNPAITIIYSGPQVDLSHATAELVLRLGVADVVISGESEASLVAVVGAIDQKKSPAVDGTITFDWNTVTLIRKPARQMLDLNQLPDPDFSVFPLGAYTQLSLPLYGSRGCIYHCAYCTDGTAQPYRRRDPRLVVDTMERLKAKHNTLRFYFDDSTMNGDTQWLEQFADELIKRNCRFQWWGFFRPWMSRLLLSHLKKAGLFGLAMSAESFADPVLKRMGKDNITREKIFQTIELLCKEGIPVTAGMIAGFPSETGNDFYFTWRQVVRLQEQFPRFFSIHAQMFQVRVSSNCYSNPQQYGITFENWYAETEPPIPEVADLVKKIPKLFRVKKPHTEVAWDRFLQFANIQKPGDSSLFEHDKELLLKTLDYIEPNARVRIEAPGYNLYTIQSQAEKRIDILEIGKVKILLSERERYTFQFLNGFTMMNDIAAKLAQEYKEKPAESFKSIIYFLYYLLDHDVPFDVKY